MTTEHGKHAAIVGVTASGKSALALEVARRRPEVELVSIDSMQVYRGMDIGTAKPTPAEQAEVVHHLIDLVDPAEEFTVSIFQERFRETIADIEARGKRALLVGGTGMYLQAAVDDFDIPPRFPEVMADLEAEPHTEGLHRRLTELDPVAAARMEPNNRRRVLRALEVTIGSGRPFSSFGPGVEHYPPSAFRLFGIRHERPVIDERISLRYARQIELGFVEEVRSLAKRPRGMAPGARQALGYRELLRHVEHDESLHSCLDEARTRTRRFARRQERWFRRDPRIRWMDADGNPLNVLDELLRDWTQ